MRECHATQRGPIARGFAKYLVRNIADWPEQRIKEILFSDAVLLQGARHFSLHRAIFIQELARPGPNGRIPAPIVTELADRMRIVARNDWAYQQYAAGPGNQLGRGMAFEVWASTRKIDLVNLVSAVQQAAQSPQQGQQARQTMAQIIADYAQGNAGRQMEAQGMMTWLVQHQNAANAPQ